MIALENKAFFSLFLRGMMVRNVVMKGVLLCLLLCLFLVSSAAAEVIVFDTFETTATLNDGNLHVSRKMILQNVGPTPIIPGELHFKLYKLDGNERVPLLVEGLTASRDSGKSIPTKVLEKNSYTDMIINIWDPLLPKFTYTFNVEYDMEFESSGILFYEVQMPAEETTIPIRKSSTQFVFPSNFHVTYAPETKVEKEDGNVVVSWSDTGDDITGNVVIEYSRLPFPRIGVKAVNIFWSIVILLLVIVFIRGVIRSRKRLVEEL